jgi:hypothetical protein
MFGLFKAIKHGLIDGWNGTNQYTHLYYKIEPPTPPNEIYDYATIRDKANELETLNEIWKRQNEMGRILLNQLSNTYDDKKRLIILNKLNVLDKQTMKTQERIAQLTEYLREYDLKDLGL